MLTTIKQEWKNLFRTRLTLYLTVVFIIATGITTWLSVLQNKQQQQKHEQASQHFREQWDNMGASNPHGAAHFGSFAFKPLSTLSSIDEGINEVTGQVLRLEAHHQNDMVYSEASDSLTISRFGKLKPALLLQYFIPLLLIFLCFSAVSRERETGRLKLLIIQGSTPRQLVFSKAITIWIYALALLLITVAIQVLLNLSSLSAGIWARTVFTTFSYALFYLTICLLTVWLSARLRTGTAALSTMLAVWVCWTIFLPKIILSAVEQSAPLPTRTAMAAAMEEDRSKGINGHDPSDQREKEFQAKILKQYKVDSLSQLTINYDGLLMQADEEYGNTVWDKHFGKNYNIYEKQKTRYQYTGILNPFVSLQNASMGFCATDMLHHLHFFKASENYRRFLIKTLNDKMAYGGSKTGDWHWKADAAFYKTVPDFQYLRPSFSQAFAYYSIDVLLLLLWPALLSMFILSSANKIKIL